MPHNLGEYINLHKFLKNHASDRLWQESVSPVIFSFRLFTLKCNSVTAPRIARALCQSLILAELHPNDV